MKVLSLFDGLGGIRIALDRLGITPSVYIASEIDKYAIQIAKRNYPDIQHIGDVKLVNFAQYQGFDLLIGGFPCQDLSIAKQGRKGLKGERSGLFWECVRMLNGIQPKYFLFENVASMKKADRNIISEALGVQPIMINSALLTAQNRKRLYWTNIPDVQQPKDKNIHLKDILENGYTERDKSYCMPVCLTEKRTAEARQLRREFRKKHGKDFSPRRGKELALRTDDKANCLTTSITKEHLVINIPHVQQPEDKHVYLKDTPENGYTERDKAYPLTATYAFATLKNYLEKCQRQMIFNKPIRVATLGKDAQGNRVYHIDGKSVTISANGEGKGAKTGLYEVLNGYARKLTPLECERLQGLPEGYTEGVSNTQRYKMIGNGFTIPVIVHILKSIKEEFNFEDCLG